MQPRGVRTQRGRLRGDRLVFLLPGRRHPGVGRRAGHQAALPLLAGPAPGPCAVAPRSRRPLAGPLAHGGRRHPPAPAPGPSCARTLPRDIPPQELSQRLGHHRRQGGVTLAGMLAHPPRQRARQLDGEHHVRLGYLDPPSSHGLLHIPSCLTDRHAVPASHRASGGDDGHAHPDQLGGGIDPPGVLDAIDTTTNHAVNLLPVMTLLTLSARKKFQPPVTQRHLEAEVAHCVGGVTTQVLGNCGFSPFPTAPATAGLLRAASAFLDAGLDWDWSDLDGYARGLAELPLACNLALLVGHGSVRVAVMGFEDRAGTTGELEAMRELVAVAMRQGAFGLSSGLIYAPGSFAETAELAELARVAAAAGGFYASHIRDEAAGLLDAMGEAIEIGRRSGAAVQLSHHKAMGRANWGRVRDSLALLERSHAGHDVLADQYPYTAGSTTLLVLLPGWAVAGGVPAMRERLADPATRRRVADDLARRERGEPRPGERELDPASVVIADVPAGPLRRHRARSLAEAARDERSSVGALVLRLLDAAPAGVPIVWHGMDEAEDRTVLAHPLVAVASDGWTLDPGLGGVPHP